VRKLGDGGGGPPTTPTRLSCNAPVGQDPSAQAQLPVSCSPWRRPSGWLRPQLRRRASAVTACSGGKSWLCWERQSKACLTHASCPLDTQPESGRSSWPPSRTPPALPIPTMTGIGIPRGKEQAETLILARTFFVFLVLGCPG